MSTLVSTAAQRTEADGGSTAAAARLRLAGLVLAAAIPLLAFAVFFAYPVLTCSAAGSPAPTAAST